MRRLFALLTLSLLFTGCLGGGKNAEENQKIEGFTFFSGEKFNLQAPDAWETLNPLQWKSDIPKNTLVAFRNNVRHARFTANLVVLENELNEEVSTFDYGKAQYEKIRSELLSYREIRAEKHTIRVNGKDAETVFIYVEGKTSPDAEVRQFMQISAVNGKKAFVAMGSFLPEEAELVAKKMETAVRSLEIK